MPFLFSLMLLCLSCQNNIDGCFLYTDESGFGPSSNCNYAVAMAVIFQLLYGLFRLVTLILLMLGKFHSE